MIRSILGKMIEWALGYEHKVFIQFEPGAVLPRHQYNGDAGYDLTCYRRVMIAPKSTAQIPAGVCVAPEDHIWLEMKSRSSTLRKKGLTVVDAVIDRDYRGEMMAFVYNGGEETKIVEVGDRLVQVIPHRLIRLKFVQGPLPPSERGTLGFGSSGG